MMVVLPAKVRGSITRKFRQTIRDAWERHVSAVYPEAKAEFDTTVIKLHASPAPLQQKLISVIPLQPGGDDNGTAPPSAPDEMPSTAATELSGKFITALTDELGAAQARAWLKNARLTEIDAEPVLLADSTFIAHWLVTRFSSALERAAASVGLPRRPNVQARPQTF